MSIGPLQTRRNSTNNFFPLLAAHGGKEKTPTRVPKGHQQKWRAFLAKEIACHQM